MVQQQRRASNLQEDGSRNQTGMPIRTTRTNRTTRPAPYELHAPYEGSNIVHRNGKLWHIPIFAILRDYNMPIAARELKSWSEIDPVDVVVVWGFETHEWFVRAHNGDPTERHDPGVNKFLVPVPTAVRHSMIELMKTDDNLWRSSLLTEYSAEGQRATNTQIDPSDLRNRWFLERKTYDGTAPTRHRIEQITRDAAAIVDLMTKNVALPGQPTHGHIVDWSHVRAVEREQQRHEDEAEMSDATSTHVDAGAAAASSSTGSDEEEEELEVLSSALNIPAHLIEGNDEMSDEEVDNDDGEYFKSTREHLATAQEQLKIAMGHLDEMAAAPGVSEYEYMQTANALKEVFASIKVLSKRVDDV